MTFGSSVHSTVDGTGRYQIYGFDSSESRSSSSKSSGKYTQSHRDFVRAFYAVLRRWQSETAFVSDPDAKTRHKSFEALVGLAEHVTPLIISELQQEPSLLVWVLEDAFGERPYSDDQVGDIEAMSNAWIAWAERNGKIL
mgnify:CR=1 FL=1|tara:strand:- start:1083 stop:1502 length:420 start_codon:yes stop_codon:yes gene_type:complete